MYQFDTIFGEAHSGRHPRRPAPDPMLNPRKSAFSRLTCRPGRATLVLAVALGLVSGCATYRPAVAPTDGPVQGDLAGGTYTAPDGDFSVRVPPVFVDWRRGEQGRAWQDRRTPLTLHADLRVEDGSDELDGAEVGWVMFGPSRWHEDEIYHVVLASPEPFRRYDDLDRYADDVVAGYIDQYDTQYEGAARRLVRKHVETGGYHAVYSAYRYDFEAGSSVTQRPYRFYTSFCVFSVPGHRLATVMIEQRPSPAESGGRNLDAWRERGLKSGGCWDEWIETLEFTAPRPAPVAFK